MGSHEISKPNKLTYEEIVSDLSLIPINEDDVLFEDIDETVLRKNLSSGELSDKLEKLYLFRMNIESNSLNQTDDKSKQNDLFVLNNLNEDVRTLESRLNSLQHFIDISKKFLSLNETK